MRSTRFIPSLLLALVLVAMATLATPAPSYGQFFVSITVAPPALPVYEQPPIPAPGYMWTPGYWAWDPDIQDYYWVPGTWVPAPQPGFLWTPGYWEWGGGRFIWYEGCWGPHIGFYGGVNYGFGYGGSGFEGGYWNNGAFFYNRAVMNVSNVNITNVYTKTVVVNNVTVNNVSYNGGQGGITAQPTPPQKMAASEHHIAPTTLQTQHVQTAKANPSLRASVNHGRPAIAATAKPGVLTGRGVVAAKSAPTYRPTKLTGTTGRPTTPGGSESHPTYTARPTSPPHTNTPPPSSESHTYTPANPPHPSSESHTYKPESRTESHPPATQPKSPPPPKTKNPPPPKNEERKPPKE